MKIYYKKILYKFYTSISLILSCIAIWCLKFYVVFSQKSDILMIKNTTTEKLISAFNTMSALMLDKSDIPMYKALFNKMLPNVSSIPFHTVLFQVNHDAQSLELLGIMPSGILMSLTKYYNTLCSDTAELVINYKRNVILSIMIDLVHVEKRMISVENKILSETNEI